MLVKANKTNLFFFLILQNNWEVFEFLFFCFLKSQLTHLVEMNSLVSMWSDQCDLAIYQKEKKKKEHNIFKLRYIQQPYILVLIFPFSLNFSDHRSKQPRIAMVGR